MIPQKKTITACFVVFCLFRRKTYETKFTANRFHLTLPQLNTGVKIGFIFKFLQTFLDIKAN